MQKQPGPRVELAPDPNVTEQTIKDAGHAAEIRCVTEINLPEVRADRKDDHQDRQMQRTLPCFNHAAEVAESPHVEKDMGKAKMNENRRDQPPQLAVPNLGQGWI